VSRNELVLATGHLLRILEDSESSAYSYESELRISMLRYTIRSLMVVIRKMEKTIIQNHIRFLGNVLLIIIFVHEHVSLVGVDNR
jgi:hypothetical protein